MNEAIVGRLIELRNADGGWGTTAARPSGTEPTALACMAMAATDRAAGAGAAASWLVARQRPDGAWPVVEGVPEPGWATSLAALALLDRTETAAAAHRAVEWLIGERGIGVPLKVRIAEFFREPKTTALDPTIRGWPWATGTFSWIEPTAYAMIALRRGWPADPPPAVRDRLDEGRRMIHDRECPGGGWNFGNKKVLGVDMEPYPDSTALALLALGAVRDESAHVERGFAALDVLLETTRSGLALSLAILCYREWARDTTGLLAPLEAAFERTGFLDDVRSLGLATLALADGPIPLMVNAR